jgi:glycosyltransferase involved in cell wall biosynthesis
VDAMLVENRDKWAEPNLPTADMPMATLPISIVIPLYNKARSIEGTLNSVFAQSWASYEVIVVDDGSTDGGDAIVSGLADHRLRLIRQPNAGVSAARNTGLLNAQHQYAAFLDADDSWMPDYLATIVDLILRFPGAGLYATGYAIAGASGVTTPRLAREIATMVPGPMNDFFYAGTLGPMPFFTSCVCVDRDIVLTLGGFKKGIKHGEDLDMWARIALQHKIVYAPAPKAIYQTEGENRAMRRMPAMVPWSFRDDLEREAISKSISRARLDVMAEYCARVDLYHARSNLLNPDRVRLREFIGSIPTKALAREKRLFQFCANMPVWLLAPIIYIRDCIFGHIQ